jgi:membrane-bound serine protease (ClpP class)
MAPGTNLGAATPVQLGGMPGAPDGDEPKQPDENKDAADAPKSSMERKMINDAVAYIRGLADLRGRNVEWAEKAVREAASLPAHQARELNVINVIARDIPELLQKIDGRTVQVNNAEQILHTTELAVEQREPDWRTELLAIITNPNVAYVLMLIGIYGLIFEFSNPGALVPGVAGAICLLLALFAFQVLPVNYAGMALMLLGVALMAAEAFLPSFGALGIGGVIAFVTGSIILMDTDVPGYGVSPALIGGIALFSGALFATLLYIAVKARRRPVVSGEEQLIGAIAVCNQDFADEGSVHIHGENWRAKTTSPLQKNQRVRVRERRGLTLYVEPLSDAHPEEKS